MDRWKDEMVKRRWIVPHWPVEHGGAGLGVMDQFILSEEIGRAGVPQHGGALIGPIIIMYGTDDQKQKFLPGIADGTDSWAQGFSEPGAGSDLASLQTRASRDGDEYIVNGQKIWTSRAERSDYIFTLVRSDPDAPKHRGISMLLIPTKSPGLTIRPLYSLLNEHRFNEVFFEDARVPVANRVGDENRGWYVAATTLDFERSGIGSQQRHYRMLEKMRGELAREEGETAMEVRAAARDSLADRFIEAEVSRMLSYRVITIQQRGQVPNSEASVAKVFTSELGHRIAKTGTAILGLYAQLIAGSLYSRLGGRTSYNTCMEFNYTVGGGTSEIQRNIIATRGLGLPRG